MERRGVLLYSGGLDSLIAAKLLLEQGIELLGLHFVLPFKAPDFRPEESAPARIAARIGLTLRHIRLGGDYMEMVKNPPHGYGKKMNPCIDCKIFFLRQARQIMSAEKAAFVATGEVVGQRPMSQMKHMLNHIEKESDLKGHLLRPLSAKLMKPTLAEQRGIVDRERLMGISGRGRGIQTQLAETYKITEYATPAGGCLFTDTFIARRVRDLFAHHPDFNAVDGYLLTVGRHFRISKSTKIIVGRNESENLELEKYKSFADYFIFPDFKGPSVFVKGKLLNEDLPLIGSIIARYGRLDQEDARITVCSGEERTSLTDIREPIEEGMLQSLRI